MTAWRRKAPLVAAAAGLVDAAIVFWDGTAWVRALMEIADIGDVSDTALSWRPAAQTSPRTIVVTDTQNTNLTLDREQDFILSLPCSLGNPQRTPLQVEGGLQVSGGRHLRVIGGEIRHDVDYAAGTTKDRGTINRCAIFGGWAGDLHVEGVKFGGDWMFEGINLNTRQTNARAFMQNLLFEDAILALVGGGHEGGDVIQNWNGPEGGYYIDKISVTATSYQGFFMQPQQFGGNPPFETVVRRCDMDYWSTAAKNAKALPDAPYDPPRSWTQGNKQYALVPSTKGYPTLLDRVWSNPWPGFGSVYTAFNPNPNYDTIKTVVEDVAAKGGRLIRWEPKDPAATPSIGITGHINLGLRPEGPWVKPEDVGTDYTSPGYLGDPPPPTTFPAYEA